MDLILLSLNSLIYTLGYFGVFLLMTLESSFIPFPSEVVLIPAGYLVSIGHFNFFEIVIVGILGSLVGAGINYTIARYLGRTYMLSHSKMFFIKKESLLKIDDYFNKHGGKTTFIGRLIPMVRQYISLPAGFANMDLRKFLFYTALGSGIWCLFLTSLGYFIGEQISTTIVKSYNLIIIILLFIAVLVFGWIYLKKKVKI